MTAGGVASVDEDDPGVAPRKEGVHERDSARSSADDEIVGVDVAHRAIVPLSADRVVEERADVVKDESPHHGPLEVSPKCLLETWGGRGDLFVASAGL